MTDDRDPQTESQIRRALGARANETTVSPDASDHIHQRASRRWTRPATYAGVAAVLVLLAGLALLNLPEDDAGVVDNVASTTTEPPDYPTATSTTTVPDSTSSVPGPDPAPGEANQNGLREPLPSNPADVVAAGLELWRDETIGEAEALAAAYATDLGITDPEVSETTVAMEGVAGEGLRAFGVHRRTESGEIADAFAFKIVTFADERGPAVTHVVSDAFRVDVVEDNTADTVRVTGAGTAFEGTALLRVNGEESLLMVGGVEFDEFSVVVPRPADGPLTIVVEGTTVFENEVPDIIAYRTVPVPRQTTLSVFGVADDDVLNVRDGAGVGNDIVTTLAPDAAGVVATGAEEFIDDEKWMEIETAAATGWVNRRFLVADHPTSLVPGLDDELAAIAGALPALDPAVLAPSVDIGGIGVYADWPTPFTPVARDEFDAVRSWSPDPDEDPACDCDLTVAEFLGFDTADWDLAETFVPGPGDDVDDANFNFAVGRDPEFFERYTTATVFIPEPNPDESLDWRRYTIVFDFEDGAPVIRGLWRWGWTP